MAPHAVAYALSPTASLRSLSHVAPSSPGVSGAHFTRIQTRQTAQDLQARGYGGLSEYGESSLRAGVAAPCADARQSHVRLPIEFMIEFRGAMRY